MVAKLGLIMLTFIDFYLTKANYISLYIHNQLVSIETQSVSHSQPFPTHPRPILLVLFLQLFQQHISDGAHDPHGVVTFLDKVQVRSWADGGRWR